MHRQDEEKERERAAKSAVRRNLEETCRDCGLCHGRGLVTIFHERYQGLPFVELKRRNGQRRKYALLISVPCTCPLGFWIREQRELADYHDRQLDLQQVIEGRIPWLLDDPTLPPESPGEVPNWTDFRIDLAMMAKAAKPREAKPNYVPPWLSGKPVPNDDGRRPEPAFVPDDAECEIPF